MLSWEYPPVMVGGLGRHVHELCRSLASIGHEVTVLTRAGEQRDSEVDEHHNGVRVVRVPPDPALPSLSADDLIAWTLGLNHALTRAGLSLDGRFDVVHAHDWLVAHAAANLRQFTTAPLVATLHATESGRRHGELRTELNRTIHRVEQWLMDQADRVVVCSDHMRQEARRLFQVPSDRLEMIPNGVDRQRWQPDPAAVRRVREAYPGPLLVYAGRLVREKGLSDLLDATAQLRLRNPGLRLVIAGDGHRRAQLEAEARQLRLDGAVRFTGFLPRPELSALLAAASVVVVPSRYEPFGMVALEAAAAGAPRVVAATGGLAETVADGHSGLTFSPGDVSGLVQAVERILREPGLADRLVRAAEEALRSEYDWLRIAERTAEVYRNANARDSPTFDDAIVRTGR
jgi:glycogen(starch) synthase